MQQRIEGVYPVVDEALRVVDQLRDQGYSPDDITLVANEDVRRNLSTNVDADVETRDGKTNDSNGDDDSFWESVKDAFTFEDSDDTDPNYDPDSDPLSEHREAISRGNVVVLVEEDTNINNTNDTMDQTDPTNTSTHPETPTRDAQGAADTPNPSNPDTVTPDSPNPDPGTPNPGAPNPANPEPGVPDPTNPEPGVPNPDNPDLTKDDDDNEDRRNNI